MGDKRKPSVTADKERLAMETPHFTCPHCGQMQGRGAAPNFTTITDPAHGRSVVILSCRNPACQAAIGSYDVESAALLQAVGN
jgi:hypothetical protein